MSERSPAIDITSLYGVESLFRGGTYDPWAGKLAGRLADFFIFSNRARFTMPVRAEATSLQDPTLPCILTQLRSRDPGVLEPVPYPVEDRRKLKEEHLQPAFASFATWAQNNRSALTRWLQLHNEPWMREALLSRVRPRSVFDVDALREDAAFQGVAASLQIPPDDILYAFDVVLRYLLYAELVGPDAYFFAHPIREQQALPILSIKPGPAPGVPLSLNQAVAAMAPSMTLDQYTSFLHEARGLIRDRKIHQLQPGALDRETTRELAGELGLPARLSNAGKLMGIAAGLVGIAGAIPAFSPGAAVVGGVVSFLSAVWTGTAGRAPSRVTWLRWALEWDLEAQASDAG